MENKKTIFIIKKESDKDSTGEISYEKNQDIMLIEQKYLFSDLSFQTKNNNDFNLNLMKNHYSINHFQMIL